MKVTKMDQVILQTMDYILNNAKIEIRTGVIDKNYRVLVLSGRDSVILFRWEGDEKIGPVSNYDQVIPLIKKNWPNRKIDSLSEKWHTRVLSHGPRDEK